MAADLVEDPSTLQTFSHDLESAFYVMHYLAGFFREASWTEDERSIFYHTVLNSDTCGGLGSPAKRLFISGEGIEFTVNNNSILTNLLVDFKAAIRKKYIGAPLESVFLDLGAYNVLEYKHDHIIKILDDALWFQSTDENLNWPVDDSAIGPALVPTDFQKAGMYTSSKRTRSAFDSNCPSSTGRKQQKSNSLA
jgi:hypothetical protein